MEGTLLNPMRWSLFLYVALIVGLIYSYISG